MVRPGARASIKLVIIVEMCKLTDYSLGGGGGRAVKASQKVRSPAGARLPATALLYLALFPSPYFPPFPPLDLFLSLSPVSDKVQAKSRRYIRCGKN